MYQGNKEEKQVSDFDGNFHDIYRLFIVLILSIIIFSQLYGIGTIVTLHPIDVYIMCVCVCEERLCSIQKKMFT